MKKKEKKICPKCVSRHLESFKTHLFLGEKKGGAPTFEHFRLFLAKIWWILLKYFVIPGGWRKKIFFARSA